MWVHILTLKWSSPTHHKKTIESRLDYRIHAPGQIGRDKEVSIYKGFTTFHKVCEVLESICSYIFSDFPHSQKWGDHAQNKFHAWSFKKKYVDISIQTPFWIFHLKCVLGISSGLQ